jgi:hypothetical protein
LLAGAALWALPAAAQGPGPGPFRLSLGYDGRLILKVLDIQVDEAVTAEGFTASTHLRSSGILRAFRPFDTRAEAHGHIAHGEAWPGTFHSQNFDSKANRRTDVAWTGSDVVATLTPPVRSLGEPPADRAQKLEAIDPETGVVRVALAAQPCGRTMKYFDGSNAMTSTSPPAPPPRPTRANNVSV